MKKTEELVKNTAIISIGKMGTQLVNFLLLPLYTSRLTTEAYGTFDFIITIATFIIPIMTMLMEESMFRFLIDCKNDEEREKIISHTFIYCLSSLMIILLISIPIILFFKYKLGYSILLYCLSMLLIALSNALARGLGKITLYSLSNFLSSFGIILLNIILIVCFNLEFTALLTSSVVANCAAAFYVFTKLHVWRYFKLHTFDKKLIKDMLKFSVPLVPNTISWTVINASDRLVIMGFSGASANGLYSVAYKFPNLINTFYSFFNIAWSETSAKIVRDNDYDYFEKIYDTVRRGVFSITLLLITGLQMIYPIFINETYMESINYVPILAVSIYYTSISAFYGGFFTAYKNTKILGTTSFAAACINLSVNLLLYRFIGVYAAAISTLVASLFLYWYRRQKTKKYMSITYKKEWYVEIGFILVMLLFYLCTRKVNFIAFCLSILLACWLNKDILKATVLMVKIRVFN